MQRYFVKDRENNYLILDDSDIHHIRNVMRNNIHDLIECVYNNTLYLCEIENINSNRVLIKEEIKEEDVSYNLTIGIGMVKEQKMDLILQKLSELGVKRIIPLEMERSIVKLDNKKVDSKLVRWSRICKEASEQSKRKMIPEVVSPINVNELRNYSFDYKYVCSLNTDKYIDYDMINRIDMNKDIIFVIGPEGGISSREEEYLESIGYESVSLGSRVMRVETASIYVASIMNFCIKR